MEAVPAVVGVRAGDRRPGAAFCVELAARRVTVEIPREVGDALRWVRWPKRLILCYHAVDDTWPDRSLSVSSALFRRQLALLQAAGYRAVTFGALPAVARPDERVVAITFDDAFTSVATTAFPILAEVGWTATVFAPTAPVTEGSFMYWISAEVRRRHPVAAAQLDWPSLERLVHAGWEVGSHSRTHRLLSRHDDVELGAELEGSRREIEERLGACASVSYPWGEVDDRVVDAARRAGYRAGSGLAGRFDWSDPMRSPRITIAGNDGEARFSFKSSRPLWGLRSSSLWNALDALRGLNGPRDEAPSSPLSRIRHHRTSRR
jgi:peptidoglycan/xylan/chitin deacetylase (PgdA/CDA1 family)